MIHKFGGPKRYLGGKTLVDGYEVVMCSNLIEARSFTFATEQDTANAMIALPETKNITYSVVEV